MSKKLNHLMSVGGQIKSFMLGFSAAYTLLVVIAAIFAYNLGLEPGSGINLSILVAATLMACYWFYRKSSRDFSAQEFWNAFAFVVLFDAIIQMTSVVFGYADSSNPESLLIKLTAALFVVMFHSVAVYATLKIGWSIYCLENR